MNASDLAWIGYTVLGITAIVCAVVHYLWKMPVNRNELDEIASEAHGDYEEIRTVSLYIRWKKAEIRKYPQFWAVALLIAWMSVPSMASMYMYSLHPPCEARNDCAATQSKGIYIGDQR